MNKIERCKIPLILPNNKVVEVEANVLGGPEGVFGTCRNPNCYDEIWLLNGDDGAWWVVGQYHKDWLPGLIACMTREKM